MTVSRINLRQQSGCVCGCVCLCVCVGGVPEVEPRILCMPNKCSSNGATHQVHIIYFGTAFLTSDISFLSIVSIYSGRTPWKKKQVFIKLVCRVWG